MKGATKTLKQLLISRRFLMADLYTFELSSGEKYYLTSYDTALSYNKNIYHPALIRRTMTTQRAGLMVDAMQVTCNFDETDIVLGVPIIQAFVAGTFDNAFLTLERVFMPTNRPLDTSAGGIYIFSGRIDVEYAGRTTVELNIKSVSEMLNAKLPRNRWMPTCQHTVYDSGCMLNKNAYTYHGAAITGSTKSAVVTNFPQANSYFDYGVITFIDGQNKNVRLSVKKYNDGVIYLTRSLPYPPQLGDNFTVYAGCDKSLTTCRDKFGNTQNFRGFPFIPRPETVM